MWWLDTASAEKQAKAMSRHSHSKKAKKFSQKNLHNRKTRPKFSVT
jgi:hypothetical protein